MEPTTRHSNARTGKVFGGLIILTIGVIFLLKQMGYFFPGWLISWPMLLIALGLFIGVRHQFRGVFWAIMMVVGGLFLSEKFYPALHLAHYLWPVIIIVFGLYLIFGKPRRRYWDGEGPFPDKHRFRRNWKERKAFETGTVAATDSVNPTAGSPADKNGFTAGPATETTSNSSYGATSSEYLDVIAVFGGVKKNVVAKNFKGGEVVSFLGGSEINLSQADIKGRVELELTQVMGGCKLIVPGDWHVESEMVAVFGGIEDRRTIQPGAENPEKVLVIKGTSVLGGLDIRSY